MKSMTDEGGMKKRTASMSSMTHFGGKSPGKKQPLKEKWSQLRQGEFGPNYTLDEVKHFYNCFSYVDQDMSGEIDVDEWQQFLTGMDQEMTATDSRRLFMHIDANHNGVIDMAEVRHCEDETQRGAKPSEERSDKLGVRYLWSYESPFVSIRLRSITIIVTHF